MRKKILIILHNIAKAQEHEWFVDLINRDVFELEFVLINRRDGYMNSFLAERNIKTWYFDHNSKKDLPKITYGLFKLMRRNKYDIVHAHLFEAAMVGMTAAWLAGVPKRIITRHHSDFHHVWHPQAVKYDKYTNRLATDIVAISKNVEEILIDREGADPGKVRLIHHGIDLKAYEPENISAERIQKVRDTYNIPSGVPVVGVISRFIELKGLQYLIPAFIRFRNEFPEAVLVLANAKGTYMTEVKSHLSKMDETGYRLITFENDVPALYLTFSMFAHVPISKYAEAFGQIYIESLACKIPSVFTLSGVAPEFAKDRVNCLVVPFCDEDAIYDAFSYIQNNPEAMKQIIQNGFDLVHKEFDVMNKIRKLEKLYSE